MKNIEVTGLKNYDSYTELSYIMRFPLPAVYGTGANPITNLEVIAGAYPDAFSIAIDDASPGIGTIITYSGVLSIETTLTTTQIQNRLVNRYNSVQSNINNVTLRPYDIVASLYYNGSAWV